MKDIIRLNPSHSLSTNATMNTVREIQQINEQELQRGIAGTPASWHAKYSQAAWVYVGNLEQTSLTEGDVICVLSQYGEIEDFDLVRDQETGASRGFAFCKYEDARSCVLAVDNLCGVMVCYVCATPTHPLERQCLFVHTVSYIRSGMLKIDAHL
jgi:RNA-binding motif protein, X-linked 2